MDEPEHEAHYVRSVERALAVIKAFGHGRDTLSLSEVARETGLTRAAARRFLLTLADLGYVRADGKHFSLTARVLELGYAFLSGMSLPEVAQPHLERLSARIGESSSVSILDGSDIVYVSRVAVSRIMAVRIDVGTRFPAHATSMGRVLLAGLEQQTLADVLAHTELERLTEHTIADATELRAELDSVRTNGWALVDQELEVGLRSIAVPIRDRASEVIAAINVSSQAARTTKKSLRETILPELRACAERIEHDLRLTAADADRPSGASRR